MGEYIENWKTAVSEWVALRPILEMCDRETGQEGGVRCRDLGWRKMAARKQMSTTLEDI